MRHRLWFVVVLVTFSLCSPLFAAAIVPSEGTHTLVVLPDTQYYYNYCNNNLPIFESQVQWIVDNKDTFDISYVLHLGDITDGNAPILFWNDAKATLSLLDGQVPYALALGNHDYGNSGSSNNRTSYFFQDQYFGLNSAYATQSSIGGFFSGYGETGKTDNSYHTFTMGGQDWLILTMEFGPRDDVVAWADSVLQSHPDHKAIVITHAYMCSQSVRYDYELFGKTQASNPYTYKIASQPGGVNDGQDIYENLLANHSNVFMVVNGHVTGDGTGYREVIREDGTVLHEMLVNYQMDVNGGNGFMRLLEFAPDGSTVSVKSYSPYLDQYDTAPDQQFTMAVFDRPVNKDLCQAVLADAPVLYYRLQECKASAPVTNLGSTGMANTGTYTSTYIGSGSLASKFDGSGTNQIAVGSIAEMSQWSIAAWVRPDAVDTRQTIITNKQSDWNDNVFFGLEPDFYGDGTTVGHWALSHHDDDTQTQTVVECSTVANPGQWYHVSATCDGNVVRLYVDGQLVDESEKSGADFDWAAISNLIGKSYDASENYSPFNGTIGEVAVFDQFLSTSDVETQRLAAFSRVTAGNLLVQNANHVTIPQQSLPGISLGAFNQGDMQIIIGDKPGYAREGVLLATVAQNVRGNVYGTVEVGLNSYGDGILTLSTTKAGATSLTEININTSVAWFPFYAGWKGGHVQSDGSLPATGYDMDHTTVKKEAIGRYKVDLRVDSANDGMLFTIGAGNDCNITTTKIDEKGNGWFVGVMNSAGTRTNAPFSFVYIPYTSENLIGGRYDGTTANNETAFGNFTLDKLATGKYSLSIMDESPETGMLVLGVTGETTLENSFISYEANGNDFIIQSRSTLGLVPDDIQFYWAFISFNDPLVPGLTEERYLPGDANRDGYVDGSDATILAGYWQQGPGATWEMGDFNGDGYVDGSDATILAGNWQCEIPVEPVYLPGDANCDGYVDGSDATILAGYWQQTDATWEMGDFNGDHVVDGSDATILAGYWQQGTPPQTAAVPEPSTLLLLLAGLVALPLLRKFKGQK